MKLIERTTIYYLLYTLFIFAIGTLLFYFLIHNVINDGIDEALHQEKEQMIENLKYETDFKDLKPTQNVILRKVADSEPTKDEYETITLVDSTGAEIHYRQLIAVYQHGKDHYQIIIRQSLEEAESLIKSLVPVEIILFLILLAGVLYLNRMISKEIWSPFYALVDKLKDYNLSRTGIIPAVNSEIDEFDDLSQSIEKMTQKIHNDFISQKEFHENSSHELQTPLAIIRNKLELLIQSKNMDEKDLVHIQGIFDAVRRLSALNKGLLLLSKIENEQYKDVLEVDLEGMLRRIVVNFKESIEQKNLLVDLEVTGKVILQNNPSLMEILLNNLFSNAVKHNVKGGFIKIRLSENSFLISNSGAPITIDTEKLFNRFIKQSSSENSVGLGLSIVKKIADISNFSIDYKVIESVHHIKIEFFKS